MQIADDVLTVLTVLVLSLSLSLRHSKYVRSVPQIILGDCTNWPVMMNPTHHMFVFIEVVEV